MDNTTLDKELHIFDLARHDWQYQQLLKEYHALDEQMMFILARIDDVDAAKIMDYIGVLGAMHSRMLEVACEHIVHFVP